MAVAYGLAAPLATGLIGGGPVTMIWGYVACCPYLHSIPSYTFWYRRWILVSILSNALMFSMGELASKYPTSAGAYYWVYRLSPPRHRLLLSWINGWLSMIGVWTVCLSVTFVRLLMHFFVGCTLLNWCQYREPLKFWWREWVYTNRSGWSRPGKLVGRWWHV